MPYGRLVVACALLVWLPTEARCDGNETQIDFFEESVRPLLIDRCQSCHSASMQESDLRLDSLDGILQGGVSGTAAISGNVEDSLIIQAVTGAGALEQMPPDEPLDDVEIAILKKWVRIGMPWPAQEQPTTPALGDQSAIFAAAKEHWAFQPITRPEVPIVAISDWPTPTVGSQDTLPVADHWDHHPIDAFIAKRLKQSGLHPSARAERRTILRRLHYDLIGLPPTDEETQAFVSDPREDTEVIASTVNRLLASQHYGERWGRYWLDLARYADTRDWQAQAELRYPYAYTYRDYVINSLNEDKPYDVFIREQIAADAYHQQDDAPELAALGFLTVGPRFRNNRLEQAADKIDVVGRGLMGITISCARCHDHKYDPIPIEDYYSLYGVFDSCEIPDSLPVIDSPANDALLSTDFESQLASKQQDLLRYKQELRRKAINELQTRLPEYLEGFVLMGIEKTKEMRGLKSQLKLQETAMTPLNAGLLARLRTGQDQGHRVLGPWHQCLSVSPKVFDKNIERWAKTWSKDQSLHASVVHALTQTTLKSQRDVVMRYADLFANALAQPQKQAQDSTEQASEPDEELRQVLATEGGWFDLDIEAVANASRLLGGGRKKLGDLQKAITEVEVSHPGAPPRAMVLRDKDKPVKPFVLLRGEQNRRGERVDRQFIRILSEPKPKPFRNGSGRRELAEEITRPSNPLTSRVLVNRVWAKYFGEGLVRSLDDFGLRSAPPSHPELLDFLASKFMENGWSLKWLHHTITTSSTYLQSSATRPAAMRVDPDNRLLWRQNRRRLDFEAMRDSILCAAGTLDRTIGGRSVRLSDEPYTTRRSIYAYIDRIELDPILRTFDFASPTASAAGRAETTIPQQALFGMNHPFIAEQARQLVKSLATTTDSSQDATVQAMYRRIFARRPTTAELTAASQFLNASSKQEQLGNLGVWQYGYGPSRALSPQESAGPFTPLDHWTGKFYQVSDAFPDPVQKHLRITSAGGHPGRDADHSVIRRWVAPAAGTIRVLGQLKHTRDNGDGVIAMIRSGTQYFEYSAFNETVKTPTKPFPVEAGQIVDLIVSPGPTTTADSFTWTNLIRGESDDLDGQDFRSTQGFGPPPPPQLSPLGQLAQALLLTNEFLYLD